LRRRIDADYLIIKTWVLVWWRKRSDGRGLFHRESTAIAT